MTPPPPSTQQSWSQPFGVSPNATSIGQYFDKHDMKESSYHLLISRLDLHICDDSHTRESGNREQHQEEKNNAVLLSLEGGFSS